MSEPEADLPAQVRDKALRLLTRREHSLEELRQKLSQRGFPHDVISVVLQELKARGDLSDLRYAQAMVSHRAKKGYGPVYIRQELRERGVDSGLIESALIEGEFSWATVALGRYKGHFKDEPIADYADWARRASYLKRRGFETGTILEVLGEWVSPG